MRTPTVTVTVTEVRPAAPDDQVTYGFAPCAPEALGLPANLGALSLWIARHGRLDVPLIVPQALVVELLSPPQPLDVTAQLLTEQVRVRSDGREWSFDACWLLVESLAEGNEPAKIWQEIPAVVRSTPASTRAVTRLAVPGLARWITVWSHARPPEDRTAVTARVRLRTRSHLGGGLEMRSIVLEGHLQPGPSASPSGGDDPIDDDVDSDRVPDDANGGAADPADPPTDAQAPDEPPAAVSENGHDPDPAAVDHGAEPGGTPAADPAARDGVEPGAGQTEHHDDAQPGETPSTNADLPPDGNGISAQAGGEGEAGAGPQPLGAQNAATSATA